MFLFLAASLFFTDPVLSDLPRAEAFLGESEDGVPCLIDRYDPFDLWTAQRVCGRWEDEDGRRFLLAVLDFAVPASLDGPTQSRVEFEEEKAPIEKDDVTERVRAIQALVPVPIAVNPDDWTKPHQVPRTCREVRYLEGTNEHWLVVAYLPKDSARWQLATWELLEEDDREELRKSFEEKFLEKHVWEGKVPPEPVKRKATKKKAKPLSERELLRRDLVHSVTNYPAWRVTDSPAYVVLDELGGHRRLLERMTNELVAIRLDYAKAVPSPIDGSNTLAVTRLYADRESYLRAAGPEMDWSAAYWCQSRREIVAYLPEKGEEKLLRTLRHEGFHQYLSYAGSMIAAAPWINEGYAEYFEGFEDEEFDKRIARLHALALNRPKETRAAVARILTLDYDEFYDDDSKLCAFNYTLAWSIAFFLEKGAPDVRFRPFRNLTRDYMTALLKTQHRLLATKAVFTAEKLETFLDEWLKFYRDL